MGSEGERDYHMNGFQHSIEDIAEATGLTRKYIDRCYQLMPFLEAYRRMAADENKYYYNSGAFDVFQQIASLKAQHNNRQQIKEILESSGLGNQGEAEEEGREEQGSAMESLEMEPASVQPPPDTKLWIDALQTSSRQAIDALREAMAAKDVVIEEKDSRIHALEDRILALPDGRTPEEIKAGLAEKERQEQEIEALKKKVGEEQGRAAERKRLIGALEQLPTWGKRKQKKELLSAIKALDGQT